MRLADKKLDMYMSNIRDIEKRLEKTVAPNDAVCKTLSRFAADDRPAFNKDNYPQMAQLMQDLVVAAFQMDLTRVITLSYSVAGIGGVSSKWLKYNNQPIKTSHHTLTHGASDPADWREKCEVIDRWHASQFASLIGRLKAIPEGNSNILNNSIALWSSEIAEGYKHSERSVPFVIAGTGGGAIKTGRYINPANDTMHQGLLLDILKGLGINKTQIGRSSENPPRFL